MFAKTSLKERLTVIILSISSVAVILTTVAITTYGILSIRHRLVQELEITANLTGSRIATFVKFGQEREKIRESLEMFSTGDKRLRAITRACVYTQNLFGDFEMMVKHVRKDVKQDECPGTSEILASQGSTMFVDGLLKSYSPVKFRDEKVGYIFIESDLSEVDDYVWKQIMTAVLVIMAVIILSYLLALALQRTISAPILHLLETTRKVARERDYSIRANNFLHGDDIRRNEISSLIEAFNNMLSEVEERRQLLLRKNQELVKAKEAAEMANRSKSQFLASISHELRTPLNAIIGFSDIITKEMMGPIENRKYTEYARDINESGEHLLGVINDVLDISKAEAGKLEPALREINIRKSIDECVTYVAKRAKESGIEVTVSVPPDLPNMVADRVMFKRIISNLLSNAVKFTNAGGKIRIYADARKTPDHKTQFIIVVEDTGIGMSRADIEFAFHSFVQLDGGLNRKYEGTGLGLPLTKKLVEIHGGSIRLDSTVGEGTKAILRFYS